MSIKDTALKAVGVKQIIDLGSKVGIGILVGMLLGNFVCGTKQAGIEHYISGDTVQHPDLKPDTVYVAEYHYLRAHDLKGIARDSSDCPEFDLQDFAIDGDTLSLLGINAKTQTIDFAFFAFKDSEARIRYHDSTIINTKDSTVIHEVAKVPGLGYAIGALVSTERFGAYIDGYYQNYHLFFAPRLRYLDQGNLWKKLGVEAGVSIALLRAP